MAGSPDTDSLCSLMEQCNLSEQERTRFMSQLADFPHSFQLQDQEQLGPNQLKKLKSGLESALRVGFHTNLETARARNLLAYTLDRLHETDDALQQLDQVLEMEDQKHNLVTLANKAVILYNQHHLSRADDLVQSLKDIKANEDFSYLVVLAKAELAFAYTRMRPSFYHYAVVKFEEVIPRAKRPEKWLWQFGLALTKRRLIRAKPQFMAFTPSENNAAELRDLLLLFLRIAENCGSNNLKAKTYAELATLLFMVSKTSLRSEFNSRARMNAMKACELALGLDNNDNSVLCKCGRIFRYLRKTEMSRDLLEKALAIRPSSTGYHHLGITYKALATSEKHKDGIKMPGFYNQPQRQNADTRMGWRYSSAAQQPTHTPVERSQLNRGASAHCHTATNYATASGSSDARSALSTNREVRIMQRMIKSPPRGVTCFTREDKFIQEALLNFERAVEFSERENARAAYDMALLLKALGELQKARGILQDMLNNSNNLFDMERINVYEQIGLITKQMSETETDENEKKHLLKDSTSMLQLALQVASKICSKCPAIKQHLAELYMSFPILLQDVERSGGKQHQKMEEKARLFQLIKDHKQSLELLQELERMGQNESTDPKYLKLCIEEYVEAEQFEKALTFVDLLKCTQQKENTLQLFPDKQFVLKVYMQAARQALLNGSPTAKEYFKAAFVEATPNVCSSSESEFSDSSEDSRSGGETWDIAIVHEETADAYTNANALTNLTRDVFGLKVIDTSRGAAANKPETVEELRIMKKSSMVVVLAGGKISRRLRLYVKHVAERQSAVILLVAGERVPEVLKTHRHLVCPSPLLQSCSRTQFGTRSECDIKTICQIFGLLIHADFHITEA